MKPNRTICKTRNELKRWWRVFAASSLLSLMAFPVLADQHAQPGAVASSPSSGTANDPAVSYDQTAPAEPPAQEKTMELQQVEDAMGRNMGREYAVYSSRTQRHPALRPGFAGYLQDEYRSKQISGIVLAGVVAPILANLTALGTLQIYRHALRDDGGFCNHVYYDDFDDEYDTNCKGDRVEIAGMALVSSIGGLATLGVLIPGIVVLSKYSKRLRRIKHLATRSNTKPIHERFDYAIGPRRAFLSFRF